MSHLIPYLTVHDGPAAVEFYASAFGAEETGERYAEEDGRIGHATLQIGSAVFYLSDEFTDYGAYSPAALGHSTVALMLTVDDVDAAFARAVAAGARGDREPSDQGDGERRGWLIDPFGHRWALASPLP